MPAVLHHHPEIELRVLIAYSGHLQQWLDSGDLDLSLWHDLATGTPSLNVRPLVSEKLWVVAPPSADLKASLPVTLAEAAARPLVMPAPGHGLRTLIDRAIAQAKTEVRIAAQTNSMTLQKRLVQSGHGWTSFRRRRRCGRCRRSAERRAARGARGVALDSGRRGAAAAPMIFEFPFDLIVMARTYPPLPPDPALYRVLFFAPLFLVEFTTLALLTLSPMVRLSRAAFFFFALMLVVFAVWALSGFAYPSMPVPFALNVVSKILAFAAALSLFLSRRALASAPGPPASSSATAVHAGHGHG